MSIDDELRELLVEIRDNQRISLQKQEEHIAVAREQVERSRKQVDESLALQRQAIDRAKRVSSIAVPGIVLCFALIIYLVVRYL